MPCVYISTNVNLAGVDTDEIFSEITTAVATIFGKPKQFVMVLLKGSIEISFGENREPAAFAEVVAMGGINSQVKKKLIYAISEILRPKLSIPATRFVLKVHDMTTPAAAAAARLPPVSRL